MTLILPLLAIACTVLTTLTALTFCMGMGANAKPGEIRMLKRWMAGLFLLGLAGVAGGIALMNGGEMGWAALAAFAPTPVFGILLAGALFRS